MTIYKDLDWEKLSNLLEQFQLDYDCAKQCKLNGIYIYCNRVDVWPDHIIFYDEGWEYTYSYGEWDDVPFQRDISKIEFKEDNKFDLVVDWDWFEIKLK